MVLEVIIKALVFLGVLFACVLIPFSLWLYCDQPTEDEEAWMVIFAISYGVLSLIFSAVVVGFLSMKGVI